MTSLIPSASSVRFIDAPIEHTSDEEGATQALVNSASRRAPTAGSSYHSELSSASLSYQLSSSPPLHLYDTEDNDHQDHGAPGSRRYRRYLNTIVSDYESETDVDVEEEADPHIVRFEWKSDFIAVGDAFFQGGMSEQHIPRISRSHHHHHHHYRLPTISQDGDVVLYGQEIAPYLYRRMDTRVRPLLKKMPERDCHLITQLEHLIRAFKNDSWRWSHREQVDATRQAQREADRDAYHERLQQMTLSSSPDTDSIASSPESSSSSSMVMGTPPSHAPITSTSTSPPSPIHRPRFTVSDYLSKHRPTAFTLLSSPPSSHCDRRRARHEARRRRKHVDSDDDDEDDGYVMIDKDDGSDDEMICIVFQDAFQRFLGHGILHFHQLQSTSETIGRSSKQQRVTFITKPSFTSKSKPIYTHNASLLTHLQQLYTARLGRQNVKQQPS